MKRVAIFLVGVLLSLTLIFAQQTTQLTFEDLKNMIAERDISIEILSRQVRELQKENMALRAQLAPEKPPSKTEKPK